MIRIAFTIISVLWLSTGLDCQKFPELHYEVEVGGRTLSNAFAGGLNAPQFNEVDFNRDGKMDLFIFDRLGSRRLPFIAQDAEIGVEYVYAPEYNELLPPMTEWVIFRDYDNDGLRDIFCSSALQGPFGVEVYKAQPDGTYELITFPNAEYDAWQYRKAGGGTTTIYSSAKDFPAIEDVDGDGDLDLLTFENQGSVVVFYQNMTKEENRDPSDFIFEVADPCWGKFFEAEFSDEISLSSSPSECASGLVDDSQNRLRHAGSTLNAFDKDGDGDLDLFLGDLTNEHLVYLENGGTKDGAWMTNQDTRFPNYDHSVDLQVFVSSFMIDFDQDGVKDLIASVNDPFASEDINNQWFYKGYLAGSDHFFTYEDDHIMTRDMIDLGTGCRPEFFDINGDGLLDIVVGNEYFYETTSIDSSRIYIFQNVGTAETPAFKLVDEDFLEVSKFSGGQSANYTRDFTPEFGDIDGDGDDDVLIGCENGTLFYSENIAPQGQAPEFGPLQIEFMDIDVGQNSHPEIYDVNGDGLGDLIIGRKNGTNDQNLDACGSLLYFENIGSVGNPMFLPGHFEGGNDACFGRVLFTKYGSKVYSAPEIVEYNGEPRLYIGTREGIVVVEGISNTPGAQFEVVDQLFGNIETDISQLSLALGDINADGNMELLVGHQTGGMTLYKTDHRVNGAVSTKNEISDIQIWPNPTTGILTIDGDLGTFSFEIIDLSGRLLMFGKSERPVIDMRDLNPGFYVLKIEDNNGQEWLQKVIKK